jgi:Chloroplast import apparatus Tic20-like
MQTLFPAPQCALGGMCARRKPPTCFSAGSSLTNRMSLCSRSSTFLRHGKGISRNLSLNGKTRLGERSRRGCRVGAQQQPDVVDRVISGLPYLVPLFDSLRYGKFVISQYPIFADVLSPLSPLINLYFSIPFARWEVYPS